MANGDRRLSPPDVQHHQAGAQRDPHRAQRRRRGQWRRSRQRGRLPLPGGVRRHHRRRGRPTGAAQDHHRDDVLQHHHRPGDRGLRQDHLPGRDPGPRRQLHHRSRLHQQGRRARPVDQGDLPRRLDRPRADDLVAVERQVLRADRAHQRRVPGLRPDARQGRHRAARLPSATP